MSSAQRRGDDLVRLVEEMAPRILERAAQHDREGSLPFESVEALRDAGYLRAAIPREYGGDGYGLPALVESQMALARADGSTALGIGMHLIVCGTEGSARSWPEAARARIFEDVVRTGALLNFVAAEPELGSPQGGGRPRTSLRRDGEGRWRLSGRKTFTTFAPALTYFITYVAYDDATGQVGRVAVHRELPGIRIEETWDALGMRASASHDVVFEEVPLTDADILTRHSLGARSPMAESAWFPLLVGAAYFGVAEAARDYAVAFARGRTPTGYPAPIAKIPHVREQVGRMDALRFAVRALMLETAEEWEAHPDARGKLGAKVAAAKRLAANSAVEICEIAMRIVGGVGLRRTEPLERYFRDVRGGLINPPIEARALETIAAAALDAGEEAGGKGE